MKVAHRQWKASTQRAATTLGILFLAAFLVPAVALAQDSDSDGEKIPRLMVLITAAGALGTAAFGIVEGFKWTRLGAAGFGKINRTLGPLLEALEVAYGGQYEVLVRGQYKGDAQELRRTLKQGIRIGLNGENAGSLAEFVGVPEAESLPAFVEVVQKLGTGADLTDRERRLLARFEAAVDTRIEAAMTMAQSAYVGTMRIAAMIVSLSIALVTAFVLSQAEGARSDLTLFAVLIGLGAVPIAPVAKDLATAVQSAATAIRARR